MGHFHPSDKLLLHGGSYPWCCKNGWCLANTQRGGIVDDEQEIADLLEVYLKNESYVVRKFYNPLDALACIEKEPVSLAILDVMMPEIDGFSLCQKIRQKHLFPIIMLTAKIADIDKIQGLTLGADDYIVKPFNPLEVVARVKTQLRRYKQYNTNQSDPTAEPAEYDEKGLFVNEPSTG